MEAISSQIAGVLFLVALAVVLLATRRAWRTAHGAIGACDRIWGIVFPAILLFLGAFGLAGFIDSLPVAAVTAAVSAACGVLVAYRLHILKRFDEASCVFRVVRDVAVLVACVICGIFALELPWNTAVFEANAVLLVWEAAVIALVFTTLYFIGHRHGAAVAIGLAACLFIGLAEYFVLAFKGCVILPRDLLALDTAAAVAGNYRYAFGDSALVAITFAVVALALLALVRPSKSQSKSKLWSWPADVLKGVIAAVLCAAMLFVPNYQKDMNVELNYWWIIQCFQRQCFVPTFMACVQDMDIDAPEGYNAQKAQESQSALVADYDAKRDAKAAKKADSQFEQLKPSVVVIMNESFADLSSISDLGCGYTGPAFFNSASNGALLKGEVATSAFGGGTANTEFEFLTGSSLVAVGSGKYPFQMYHLNGANSIVKQFSELGYKTVGMHPNVAGNWRRKEIYPELGFDTTYFIDDFEGAPTYHNGVSDEATYDKVLDVLKQSDMPQFVFDVTMQNHSGYTRNDTPASALHGAKVDGLDDSVNAQIDEYLACIDESDRALQKFIEKVNALDKPVVVVCFGDHHPLFSRDLNDAVYPDENTAEHMQRIQQTVYGMWANYDVDGLSANGKAPAEDVSASSLGAYALQAIGAPLTDHQKAVLAQQKNIKQIDVFGYRGGNGTWYYFGEDSPYADDLAEFLRIEYLNFGSRIH